MTQPLTAGERGSSDWVRLAHLAEDLQRRMRSLREDSAVVERSRAIVEQALDSEEAYYGINTGFGILASQRIEPSQLRELQQHLVQSHAVGVGNPVPRDITRRMLELKIHALGLGSSGVSPGTFHRLLLFLERDWIPKVPSKGSLGASGDLAPLAHLALPLIGLGKFWAADGGSVPAGEFLRRQGLEPIQLEAKDGLALINGTQMMAAYGCHVLEQSARLAQLSDVVAAMSLEALRGSLKPFDPRIQQLRPHPGQALVADNVRRLLADSEILESHRFCGKVQDPYSLRCVPQVHGASRDVLTHTGEVVEREINSVTDNPLVFSNGEVLSGGNFHGQPLAFAFDYAALALAELASISERRTYLLLGGHDGLPRLLMKDAGLNSGFMIPQYTAAALVSENKVLCHPASVDSIPTSLGQEDHVSMGSIAGTKLLEVFRNARTVLAIELVTVAQALDFRAPMRAGRGVESAHNFVRTRVPHRDADRDFEDDLQACLELVTSGELVAAAETAAGQLH